ncbi:MAG: DUF86 domain-containing protein [Bernardetiaceae bacterium]|nr:DUF86 domain-containing protein [Bernardetiaceae bacterium]
MRKELKDKARLFHILDAIYEIESYVGHAVYDEFLCNSMMRVATVKQLEIIGAASANISDTIRQKYEDIPWEIIATFEKILIHEYFGINYALVWRTAKREIPVLKKQIEDILNDINMD